MVILLTLTESDDQLISGIPEKVFLTANTAATIFYTLDGTDPDESSTMYVDEVVLPTDQISITFKAIAISGSDSSAILEENYSTDNTKLNRTRLVGHEGINILPPDAAVVDNISFDNDLEEEQATSIAFSDLDIQASTTNRLGEDVSGDTTISFINLTDRSFSHEPPAISYLAADEVFDPLSQVIVIDGSTAENFDNQQVRIINRAYHSMDVISRVYNSSLSESQLTTSHLVRYIRNPDTGKTVFYYRDSRENRWIKSIQTIEGGRFNLSAPSGRNQFVFRWIQERALGRIF